MRLVLVIHYPFEMEIVHADYYEKRAFGVYNFLLLDLSALGVL